MAQDRPIFLQTEALSRQISPTAAVSNIALTLRQGDVLGLLGLNGAGKTTTLKMLAGLLVPDSGDIQIGGHSLAEEKHRIASLSKGFRQRVGLAQAIIHQPKLILLDEPSNGLDPHQMQGMRTLITSLGEDAAVIFSTHLLPEAIAVCNHIAVMHNGRIVASELDANTDSAAVLQRDKLETLFANLVQFGTPKAPVRTLTTKVSSTTKGAIDA